MRRIEEYKRLLLNTEKNNSLIDFPTSNAYTFEVTDPGIHVFLKNAAAGNQTSIYDPERDPEMKLTKNRDALARILADQITSGEKMLIQKDHFDLYQNLPLMIRRADSYRAENGYEITYLVFGCVRWCEADEAHTEHYSPLLILPAHLEQNAESREFSITATETAAHTNDTLSYKIQKCFGTELPGYPGGSFDAYADGISRLMRGREFQIEKRCFVTQFQFAGFNMYRDLMEHRALLEQHPVVQVLMGERRAPMVEEADYCVEDPLISLHSVVDADSSQISAIEMAKAGFSFVLQGPPGTGKSQTITNIIAESLADGKKVLFVSEKRAALDFVYHKLDMVGLNDFCLRLHSPRTGRKLFVRDIHRSLQLPAGQSRQQAEFEIGKKIEAKDRLDRYVKELHRKRPVIEKSLYQLFEIYNSCNQTPNIPYAIYGITERNEEDLLESMKLINQYVDYVPSIGYDYQCNHWYGYNSLEDSIEHKMRVKENFAEFASYLERLIRICEEVPAVLGVSCKSLEEIAHVERMVNYLAQTRLATPAFFDRGRYEQIRQRLQQLRALSEEIRQKEAVIAKEYRRDVYDLDAADVYKQLLQKYSGVLSRMMNREYKSIVTELQMGRVDGQKPAYPQSLDILKKLYEVQEDRAAFDEEARDMVGVVGSLYRGIDTDWDSVARDLELFDALMEEPHNYDMLAADTPQKFMAVCKLCEVWKGRFSRNRELSEFHLDFIEYCLDPILIPVQTMPVKKLKEWLRGCIQNFDDLDTWINFMRLVEKLSEHGDMEFVRLAVDDLLDTRDFAEGYRRQFYRNWIERIIRTTPILTEFSRDAHERDGSIFRLEDRIQFDISRQQIRAKLSGMRPDVNLSEAGSPISLLMSELQKKVNPKTIRQILMDSAELIQAVKPCFMMSPMSVSTYLSDHLHFDTIIFDEASQILPQEALGAIMRGKQVIIVGDSQQMPPRESMENEEAARRNEAIGYESILDLGCTRLHQRRLMWHYRSRHEGLIYFSNRHFYDDSLITFPSTGIGTGAEAFGLSYTHVAGTYDKRSRTNREEAEQIVAMVFEHIRTNPKKSLGVVVPVVEQEELIRELIREHRESLEPYDEFFEGNAAEPFFVKNIESVQGDERDVILLGFTFGPDKNGKLQQNFGSLSQKGGERRLNVAITRAKFTLHVIASFHAQEIEVKPGTVEAVRLLALFADYAEHGPSVLGAYRPVRRDAAYDTYIEDEVCEILRQEGYATDRMVGFSGNKIEIAVTKPGSGAYFMAIEGDGAIYRESGNARERDRLRREVLEDMGWKYYRIWSTEWYKNHEVEKTRLLRAVANAAKK